VKVEVDVQGRARRFYRRAAGGRSARGQVSGPGVVLQHIGIYAFTMSALERWMSLPVATAEASERLEQLRPLEAGMTIGVAALAGPVRPGVDTEADLRMAEAIR
jgi:3-deoxy-manno-octulosonate cytidylyltransferase (CMP-KDO synthetase)